MRLYPQLPATIVEARNGVLAVFLHDADADTFDAWVRELGLEEWPPSEYEYRGETHWKLKAVGRYAEVQVEVSAYPAPQRGSAVAA
ncbi:hypothetical protein E6W39_24455 [Kitasatospora acidiphila]|uniref:Glyoxalase-like domain-containing protein n=1 Tax=Kitasatospora acidiphila TaxID=2567942 RepID=A0A540W6Z9_9ACTN|nr:hypothetical protein [Kitasatospora acidiphila]TQF04801.1 hypothetical protein E6W39_24455 [Kitasatospora acidiphila]